MNLRRHFILRQEGHFRQLLGFIGANWQACADNGKPLSVEVTEYKSQRSIPQNNLYWKRLEEIADNAWVDGKQFSRDAWHHEFGSQFLPKIPTPSGELVPVSTTTLDVAEFTEYLNKIEAYVASNLGLELAA
jgi:hypothetical protein